MVEVTLAMRRSIASIACAVPSVIVEVSRVRRESIDWIVCAAPSVNDDESEPRRLSMVSVTDFVRASKVCSSDLELVVERAIESGHAALQAWSRTAQGAGPARR